MPSVLRSCTALLSVLFFNAQFASAQSSVPEGSEIGEVPFSPLIHERAPASWADGPIVEIYVRGFKDSDGDGHGDLNGVTEKLDYLQRVGFTGIWLMPVFASSDRNHGYAVKNYRKIEADYGTQADLQRLIQEAHKRGMGIMLDYTLNQTSTDHVLFQSSIDSKSPYRDWFIWSKDKPEGWSGYADDPWHPLADAWYYGVYDRIMPDFNWHNPAVLDFHLNNIRYWMNLGVDGLRLDAVGPLVENGPLAWVNQPQSLAITHRVGAELKRYPGRTYQVCEAPSEAAGFAAAEACGSAFAFGLQSAIIRSAQLGRVDRDLIGYLERQPVARMGTFLSNHDTFPGLRVQHQMKGDEGDYRIAAATQYLLPGVPFTLYGEEIGMSLASEAGATDEQIRAPMPWTGQDEVRDAQGQVLRTFAGFTALPPQRARQLFRPLPDNWRTHNVAAQEADPGSLLHFYRQLIQLRKSSRALTHGAYRRIDAFVGKTAAARRLDQPAASMFSFIRETQDERVLVVINYANQTGRARVQLSGAQLQVLGGAAAARLLSRPGREPIVELPAKSFVVYRLQR